MARTLDQALEIQTKVGFPTIIRPSFTLGGSGGGIAYNREEFVEIVARGLELSPVHEVLIEESVLGWKEFEMEVVRDSADNCIIVCSGSRISIRWACIPATRSPSRRPRPLLDKEYQRLRDASIAVLRKIGVDTGGSNVQFGVNSENGRVVVIEMNPRVSRSSALASKATGFPIAKVAAKLAIGYTLDELRNEITGGKTPASFEPAIDYVVTKIPRFAFEKFPAADARLTTQMKSVGEVMAIGRTLPQRGRCKRLCAWTGNGQGRASIRPDYSVPATRMRSGSIETLKCANPSPDRIFYVADAFRAGLSLDEIYASTHIDRWFLDQIGELIGDRDSR